MGLQEAFDAIGDVAQHERSRYHLTLGELIELLEDSPSDAPIEFSDGDVPTSFHSYRGYYEDLAFYSEEGEATAGGVLERAREASGSTYTGYKGGDFVMGDTTPLWKADRSEFGRPVVGLQTDGESWTLILGDK